MRAVWKKSATRAANTTERNTAYRSVAFIFIVFVTIVASRGGQRFALSSQIITPGVRGLNSMTKFFLLSGNMDHTMGKYKNVVA